MFNKFLGQCFIFFCLWGVTLSEVFEECGDRNNVYLATNESCSKYIYCDGDNSFSDECGQDTPYFSETEQTCDTDVAVCRAQVQSTTVNPQNNSTLSAAPPTTTTIIVSNNNNTTLTNLGNLTTTTVGVPTSVVTTVTPSTTSKITTPVSGSPSFNPTSTLPPTLQPYQCPATDDPSNIVFLPHSTSCSKYYMCYHGHPMSMQCSSTLYFDPISHKCDYPENVHCQLESASPHEKCQIHTIDVYPYASNCNYYYLCRFGYLMVTQCPLNMDWDYEKKACRFRGTAKCYRPQREAISLKFFD